MYLEAGLESVFHLGLCHEYLEGDSDPVILSLNCLIDFVDWHLFVCIWCTYLKWNQCA